MSTDGQLPRLRTDQALVWLPILLGMLALYGPTITHLFRVIWASDQQGHGPIVLAICIWLIWRRWPELNAEPAAPKTLLGVVLACLAMLLYVFGRTQGVVMMEVASAVPMVSSAVLLLRGSRQLRAIWFALFFMFFLIPLPGDFVDAVTQPMKIAVSHVAEALLYALGYPISRSGVILQIGQYQLMVADACAGLQTLFVLEAIGLLYLNIVRHSSLLRNVGLAILIVPISFAANVIRVTLISLVTYHWGDAAGQGFLHGFAGIVLFLSALLLIIAFDSALRFGGTALQSRSAS